MTEVTEAEIVPEKSEKATLGKISTETVEAISNDASDAESERNIEIEKSILQTLRLFLREFGVRKSTAAIRDAVDISHTYIGPKEAVSALSNFGLKASFGNTKLKKLSEDFFPLIAFNKDGRALLVNSAPMDDKIFVTDVANKNKKEEISFSDFISDFSGYVIIAKQLTLREKEERTGHWFFSAFRKSKWTYAQVMIAAMVSNFLSLTTALFTMTVYDRIIPNGAFESLIALSIGVIIALGFDFLIKSLRARFIDTASKKADLEISRRLFERILTLTPSEQRQKTGAMAGTIREFETLREFFNSSTLILNLPSLNLGLRIFSKFVFKLLMISERDFVPPSLILTS